MGVTQTKSANMTKHKGKDRKLNISRSNIDYSDSDENKKPPKLSSISDSAFNIRLATISLG